MKQTKIGKPCRMLGYCPYGPLVEQFPLPEIPRCEAVAHHEYMIKALADGVFDTGEVRMSRKEAEKDIAEFNEFDYPEKPTHNEEHYCSEFGHQCPVFTCAEGFVDEG